MLLWFSQGCMSNVLNKRTWTCGGHARLIICFWCDTYTVVFYFRRVLPLFFHTHLSIYTQSRHTFFLEKSHHMYIYIYVYLYSPNFWESHPPRQKKKHIINESHGFAPIFREICWLLPWSDHGHQIPAGPGSEPDKQLRRISHSFWKPRISRRSTDCRIYIWCIYLHYGEKNG